MSVCVLGVSLFTALQLYLVLSYSRKSVFQNEDRLLLELESVRSAMWDIYELEVVGESDDVLHWRHGSSRHTTDVGF